MGAFGLAHVDKAMWRTHEGECFSCAVSKALKHSESVLISFANGLQTAL